jgi:hypothetical protein
MQAKTFFKSIEKDKLVEMIEEATNKMFNINKVIEQKQPTEKAQAILEVINNGDFGCKKPSVIKLIQVVTGEDLESFVNQKQQDYDAVFLAAFKIKRSCNWQEGESGIITDADNDESVSSEDGFSEEYSLPDDFTCMVCPTHAEIVKLINQLKKDCK